LLPTAVRNFSGVVQTMAKRRAVCHVIPSDVWAVIALFTPIEELLSIVYTSRAIQNYVVSSTAYNFESVFDSAFEYSVLNKEGHGDVVLYRTENYEGDKSKLIQTVDTLFRLFKAHNCFSCNPLPLFLWSITDTISIETIATMIEDERLDVAAYNNYALCSAILNNKPEIVKMLLYDHRVSTNNNMQVRAAIHEAVKYELNDVIHILVMFKREKYM
jgi:hypothetical protein